MEERTLRDELVVLRVGSELLDGEPGVVLETTGDDDGDEDDQEIQGKRDLSRFAESLPFPR